MSVMLETSVSATDGQPAARAGMPVRGRWSERRRRAGELSERWPFATEVLGFYSALLDVQERAFEATRERRPAATQIGEFVGEIAFPHVVAVSVDRGPERLGMLVVERFHAADASALAERWLRGDELDAVERYLARASASPVLEALDQATLAQLCTGPRDELHCPACGGVPQVSYFAASSEDLVTGHRYLECSRCVTAWPCSRLQCPACGEAETAKLLVYNEIGSLERELSGNVIKHGIPGVAQASAGIGTTPGRMPADLRFPHMRIDGCTSCRRYVLNVDLGRDGRAVPAVDELAALPLDLYAKELDLTKITPNLMGF